MHEAAPAGSEAAVCSLAAETIVTFDLWHLALPVASRRDHGIGTVAGEVEVIVLRLRSAGGSEGYGEAAPWAVFSATPEATWAALERYIRPRVLGRPVADVRRIMHEARHAVAHCSDALAALETALFDLIGHIAGQPVWALLGGRFRREIALSCSLANPDFAADLALLDTLRDEGVGIVKLKAGFADHAFDLYRLEQLRKRAPELSIRVDFNQGLPIDGALTRVRDIAAFQPDFIEQPVRAHLYTLMRRIREAIDVPLLADESVFGPEDLLRAIDAGICDGVSVKIMKSGGLTRARDTAELAAAAGLSAYGGDMFETGLGHLAGTHLIAATPAITLGCEFYQARYYLVEDVLESAFPIVNGRVRVPDTAGLGIRPDSRKLSRFALHHISASASDSS